ncbi:hypothetical protein CPLU01_15949, partial [Colletotrichum plurivorum]
MRARRNLKPIPKGVACNGLLPVPLPNSIMSKQPGLAPRPAPAAGNGSGEEPEGLVSRAPRRRLPKAALLYWAPVIRGPITGDCKRHSAKTRFFTRTTAA